MLYNALNNDVNDVKNIFELYLEAEQEPKMTVYANGNKAWRLHGKLHRVGAPAVEQADGGKQWWLNGKRHREGAPAFEWANGVETWWVHGKMHREDGPAAEDINGNKSWYLNGIKYDDIESWAEAVLRHQKKPATQDDVDELIAQVMQADLFD